MRSRVLLVALAVCAVLTACGGDEPPPVALPPLTDAPSATPTPGPEAVPSAATEQTPDGAVEFVRFWFQTLNDAALSGDTSRLRAISAPQCETCDRFVGSIDGLYGAGGRIEGGRFTVRSAEAAGLEPEATEARVSVLYDVTATKQISASGEVLQETESISGEVADLELVREDAAWLLGEFQ